ncbi:MAG: flagellar motor switch protein FliG [Burkholderiaceae bacterium]|nr:flagellar motor switch protein FliG [Burkholderiaceae bacterium]MEB2352472.1 flagellar motor switch protein FliG [Burkholderiaceae bacterium]
MNDEGLVDSAILLMTLGEDAAAAVFRHLAPREVRRLGETMARLHTTSRDKVDAVLGRFHSASAGLSTLVGNTDEYVRSVLRRALGEERAGLLIGRILQGDGVSGIENLKWMDPRSIADLIRNEHPQIIASILVHLEREQASGTLMQFDEALRNEIVLRIATLDVLQPAALRELDEVLERVLASGDALGRTRLDGSRTAAEIIAALGGTAGSLTLDALREHDPDLAQKIADLMFTFEDIDRLDDRAIQLLLREVQGESLIVALKGADAALRERIFRNMSQRAAETLREDLESKGPVRISEVEAEQKEILKTVRRLADEGQIAIGGGGDDALV